ncbi:MAG: DUF973 family protein [Euryarchaeota archaeon]|nr:DUF973 family protein [Euryarchaeota archaeon]MDE1835257.1 DUF973 family protein [Euryarchaeota archaeon]MDE1881081.1 DUF973 family protein [Euryarchaeota archaeon]MDE2043553.1 DUF973 family protein [Thermoplasmata archaeon]
MAAQPPPGTSPYGASPPAYGQQPQAWSQPPSYGAPPAAPAAAQAASSADIEAAGTLKLAYLMGLIGSALFFGGNFIANPFGLGIPSLTAVYIYLGIAAGGAAILIIGTLLVFLGFSKLKKVEPRFGTPAILTLLGLIGVGMLIGAVVLIALALLAAVSCATTTSTTCATDLLAAVGTALLLLAGGALLALIGVIGQIIGNMRASERYQESLLKIGGILLIIPLLNVIAAILLFITYMKVESKLKSGFVPTTFVGVPATQVIIAAPQPAYGGYAAPPAATAPAPMYAASPPAAYGAPPAYQAPVAAQPPVYQTPVASYSPAVAAAPAPAASPAGAPNCQKCGKPTTFVPQYSRYYCYGCAQYA